MPSPLGTSLILTARSKWYHKMRTMFWNAQGAWADVSVKVVKVSSRLRTVIGLRFFIMWVGVSSREFALLSVLAKFFKIIDILSSKLRTLCGHIVRNMAYLEQFQWISLVHQDLAESRQRLSWTSSVWYLCFTRMTTRSMTRNSFVMIWPRGENKYFCVQRLSNRSQHLWCSCFLNSCSSGHRWLDEVCYSTL